VSQNVKCENAKIERAQIGFLDGPFRVSLFFTYRAGGQGCELLLRDIPRLLKVVGVSEWSQLPGRFVRVESAGLVKRIGHPVDDEWIVPGEEE
jgi:hypothetical protein